MILLVGLDRSRVGERLRCPGGVCVLPAIDVRLVSNKRTVRESKYLDEMEGLVVAFVAEVD